MPTRKVKKTLKIPKILGPLAQQCVAAKPWRGSGSCPPENFFKNGALWCNLGYLGGYFINKKWDFFNDNWLLQNFRKVDIFSDHSSLYPFFYTMYHSWLFSVKNCKTRPLLPYNWIIFSTKKLKINVCWR